MAQQVDRLFAVHATMCRMEYLLAGAAEDDGETFGNVPLPLEDFLTGMTVVDAYAGGRSGFLDLGCGSGAKLALAHHLGWDGLVGVEHNPRLASLARHLSPESDVRCGDALDVDCSGLRVVYSYRLFQDDSRQRELGEHIAATADPGTLVFYPRARFPAGEHIAASVWRL